MTRKEIKKRAARYLKFVEWNDEDQCFIGRCPELFIGAIHGSNETKVYTELCETVEEWIALIQKDGATLPQPFINKKKCSGKFVLRMQPDLHRRLLGKASVAGESLNSYCVKALANR